MAGLIDKVTLALGLREPTVVERIQSMDWRDYVPQQRVREAQRRLQEVDWRDYAPRQYRQESNYSGGLLVAAGVILGVAIAAYATRDRLAPVVDQVKDKATDVLDQATQAAKDLQQQLPERLRITRMEEEQAQEAKPGAL